MLNNSTRNDLLPDNNPLRLAFDKLDLNKDGKIDSNDLLNSYLKLKDSIIQEQDEELLNNFIMAKAGSKTLTFEQFCQILDAYGLQLIPENLKDTHIPIDSNLAGLLRDLALNDETKRSAEFSGKVEQQTKNFDWLTVKHLIAGGIAGGVSRTVVSPFERMKILFQVQANNKTGYDSVYGTLAKIWREEGFLGYMRGNGTNVIRIVPYSAVQFASYERFKALLMEPGHTELDTPRRLTAGALAGITSVICTYPLDIVRTRLSVQSANMSNSQSQTVSKMSNATSTIITPIRSHTTKSSPNPKNLPGIWGTLKIMYKTEGGIRALYQGLGPTLMGVAPYVALNFQSYEVLRAYFTPPGESSPSGINKLICGALAGTIAQTFTYPLDVLRRRMQVNGLSDMLGYKYRNTWHAITDIISKEGIKGLYKGMIPNYLKVAPAIGVSFYTYEICKSIMNC